jgi:hypothetical protein
MFEVIFRSTRKLDRACDTALDAAYDEYCAARDSPNVKFKEVLDSWQRKSEQIILDYERKINQTVLVRTILFWILMVSILLAMILRLPK